MSHTVLVVDDDASVLEVVADMLEDLGCDVISAGSGTDALDHLRRNDKISILITDINMPGMDGHELAERARRIRPELKVLQLSGRERRQRRLSDDQKALHCTGPCKRHATNNGRLLKRPRAGARISLAVSASKAIAICAACSRPAHSP